MILNVFKALAVSLVFGTIPGANAFAVGRFGSLSYHGNSTIVARQSDIAPYSTDPEFNPHLNAPDVFVDDLCRDHKHQEDIGNWYCQKVDQVIYSKVTKPGTYEADTFMDNESGACSKSPKQFNGDLAPHNEPASTCLASIKACHSDANLLFSSFQLSIIFRAPLRLKQFSV